MNVQYITKNSSDNLSAHPPDNGHTSDVCFLSGGQNWFRETVFRANKSFPVGGLWGGLKPARTGTTPPSSLEVEPPLKFPMLQWASVHLSEKDARTDTVLMTSTFRREVCHARTTDQRHTCHSVCWYSFTTGHAELHGQRSLVTALE